MIEIGSIIRVKDESPDNAEWYGRIGIYTHLNEHHEDGDFFGVQFPEATGTIYFWRTELEVLGTFRTVFSLQPYTHKDYHTWAIAIYEQIMMDVWENGSECPFFWGKHDDLQEMIDRKDGQLLKLLTPSGQEALHQIRYDRIMAQS